MFAMTMAMIVLAQAATEPYGLVLTRGLDTVAIERVTRDATTLRDEILVPGQARLAVSATTDGLGCVTAATVAVWPWGAAEEATPVQHLAVRLDGDSLRIEATARGATRAVARPHGGARFLLLEQAVAAAGLVIECGRAAASDSTEVPAVAVPNFRPVTVRLRAHGDSTLVVTSDSSWVVHPGGRLSRFRVGRDGLLATRVQIEALDRPSFATPDYSAPEGAPYSAESVTVRVNDLVTLAGTLTIPVGATGPVPAVVTISGSGAQDRDGFASIAGGWRPFRDIADTLGCRGIAVLRLDDRGTGASTGDAGTTTERTTAEDIRAGVRWLRAHPLVAKDRIFLLGHSEGVRVAMIVAADDPSLAGLVLLSGAADTRAATLAQALWLAEHGPSAGQVHRDSVIARVTRMMDSAARTSPREVFRWDPAPLAARIAVPVAIFHGRTDRQVPSDQADSLQAVFRRAGNLRVTMKTFADRNHLLVPDPDGDFLRYDRLPSARLAADVKGAIADWIAGSGGA